MFLPYIYLLNDVCYLFIFQNEQFQFPHLAHMAQDFLAIPATTTPSECAFSTAGNLITDQRGKLVSKTVQASMCLKSWLTEPLKDMSNSLD